MVCVEFNDCFRNMNLIYQGIGDKLGALIRALTIYGIGMAFSFLYEWRLAVVMVFTGPIIYFCMIIMNRVRSTNI